MNLMVVTLIFTSLYSQCGYSTEKRYQIIESNLSQVGYFSVGMNGFIGETSDGEADVKDILKSKNATDILLRIANNPNATSEGKLYAACGLKQLNNENVESMFTKERDKEVSVLQGDILRKVRLKDIYFSMLKQGCWPEY